MMVSLIARARHQTVWSQRLTAVGVEDVAEGLEDVPSVVFEAVEAAVMQMPRLAETEPGAALQVNARIARALAAMFSYDADRLREADRLLEEAAGILPSDRLCAWRSLVRQIMFVERTEPDATRLRDEADALARRAMEISDGTPLVLALVSLTRVMVDENPEAGTVLARTALRRSPFNPFACWAGTAAHIRHGEHDAALALARRGAEIAARSPLLHSWEALAGLAALHGGHIGPAIAHFESAFYRAPNYRAAMRHWPTCTSRPDRPTRRSGCCAPCGWPSRISRPGPCCADAVGHLLGPAGADQRAGDRGRPSRSTQASAICASVWPRASAMRLSARMFSTSSR
jgi:hypothetical protein